MAANILTIEYAKANQALTGNLIRAVILCDTVSDLPAVNAFTNYELIQGSKAIVIEDNTEYRMNSAGNWFLSGDSFVDVYTKQQIDSLLDDKQDELTTAQLNAVNSGITAEKLTTDEAALTNLIDSGAKNICNWDSSTSTISGVTFTINNDDKTVSTSGVATARAQKGLYFTVSLPAGKYVLSGCPAGGEQGGAIKYCLYVWDSTTSTRVSNNDTGDGIEFDWTPDSSHSYSITIDIRSQTDASGLVFKPMICTKDEWDVSHKYVQYVPTNKELDESKIGKSRTSISSNSNLNDYMEVGHFRVISGTISATITNTPFTNSGYILDVDYWYHVRSDTNGCIQTATADVSNTLIEKKRIYQYQNGAWSWTQWVTTNSTSIPT